MGKISYGRNILLSGAEATRLAWQIVDEGADFFMSIKDNAAKDIMRVLVSGVTDSSPLMAGECAAAGLAGALAAAADPAAAQIIRLNAELKGHSK